MASTVESRTLSVRIERPLAEVYRFTADPRNFSRWAAGLGTLTVQAGDTWQAETPQGRVRVRVSAPNSYGILDHYVMPEAEPEAGSGAGSEIYIPMRVIANGAGTELLFTLFRLHGWSDAQFAADATMVERDLHALKALLEA